MTALKLWKCLRIYFGNVYGDVFCFVFSLGSEEMKMIEKTEEKYKRYFIKLELKAIIIFKF